jgi:hypothetical protein
MWRSCELRMIQPAPGKPVGAEVETEKWIQVKLVTAAMHGADFSTERRMWEWYSSRATFPLQGKYSIVSNHVNFGPDDDFIIGLRAHRSTYIWRYNWQELTLYFGKVATLTMGEGKGAMTAEANPKEVTNELELYNVILTKRGFAVEGNLTHGGGFVRVKSSTGKPFAESGRLVWTNE